ERGLEPLFVDSKSTVLPLDDSPIRLRLNYIYLFYI
ncbi:unnamed protein product, partial [marine sediment metagenome]